MITLYGNPVSNNVNKVRYCLNYLGLDYELKMIDLMKGENQSDEFAAICPTRKVPAISIDGKNFFESNAINRYLASQKDSPFFPQDPEQRAQIDQWIEFSTIHINGAVSRVTFNRVLAPLLKAEVDENSVKAGLGFLDKYLPIVENQLSRHAYLAGNEFTLADITLLAALDTAELADIDLSSYPKIGAWRQKLQQEAFYQKCYKSFSEFVKSVMAAGRA